METVLKQKPSGHKNGGLAFLLRKEEGGDEKYRRHYSLR